MEDKPSRQGLGGAAGPERAEPGAAPEAPVPEPLAEALRAIDAAPERLELWEQGEGLVAELERASELAALYRSVLRRELPRDVALELGERAVQFHGAWLDEPGLLAELLDRVLAIDPTSGWAFERLSVLYTTAERWEDLFGLYDRVLLQTSDEKRRRALLHEAAYAAKDFAGHGARAIGYFEELAALSPGDAQIASSLERLLEREKRYPDLIRLWTARLEALPPDAARAARARIAAWWLDPLGDPGAALDVAAPLLADAPGSAPALDIVERILASPTSPPPVRDRALAALRDHYVRARAPEEVVRVLLVALEPTGPAARGALHREIAARQRRRGDHASAVEHYAALVALEPASRRARANLRLAAERTGRHDHHAAALAAAADACAEPALAVALRFEAAGIRADREDDAEGAIELYRQVVGATGAGDATVRAAARRLSGLYERTSRAPELIDVLERLGTLEPDLADRRAALGRAARLADGAGAPDRALAAWRRRLAEDAADREALDAVVLLLDRMELHEPLVGALRARVEATPDGPGRRADQIRIARTYADRLGDAARATAAWLDVERSFGPEEETVDALADLFAREQRWPELAALLERALGSDVDPARRVALLHALGDALRERLGAPAAALARYREALLLAPGHAGVRRGLLALIAEPGCAAAAVQSLVDACAATGDVAGRLALVEHRLATAEDDGARARVLREAAELQETHAGDLPAALASIGRALALAPGDEDLEAELVRLGEATGDWAAAAAAYGEAARSTRDDARRAELELTRGTILETYLGDDAGALDAYASVLAITPDAVAAAEAGIRAAGRLGQWDAASRALVRSAAAREAVEPALVAAMEEAATAARGWDGATAALSRAVWQSPELPPALARELEASVATWHRDRRGDPGSAERTILSSHERNGSTVDTLRLLASIQRRAPGRPLVDTLLALADAGDSSLEALHEAAEITLGRLGEPALARSILERVLAEASTAWVSEAESDKSRLEWFASWALDYLVRDAVGSGEHGRAIEMLVEGAWLPFIKGKARGMILQAAAIAANDVGDVDRAIDLCRGLLDRAADDAVAIERLGALYERSDRLEDLLALHRHELSGQPAAPPIDRRLSLRLEMAEVLTRLGDEEGRLRILRDNLEEEPGHPPSIEQLGARLEAGGRAGELLDLLWQQAIALEERENRARARDLWAGAARVAEGLGDLPRALEAQRRTVAIAEGAEALEAIARLHVARGEPGAAVPFLERRLAFAYPPAGAEVIARLARAHLGAGQPGRARACLERGLEAEPSAAELRDLLASLYRDAGDREALVSLLRAGASGSADAGARLACLREAGDLLVALGRPLDAVPMLEGAVALAPEERATRMKLSGALLAAGRLDEAEAHLAALAQEFGKRRSRERAEVHHGLARVARARGDCAAAIRELEAATGMDVEHAGALQLLGELHRDAGDLERAERSFRALLLLVLRRASSAAPAPPGAEPPPGPTIGAASVLLELHRIARRLGREERAAELLESAFEAARQSEAEAQRLEGALRGAGEQALLLRALEGRAARTEDPAALSAILSELADVLDASEDPDAGGRALEARLRALGLAPGSEPLLAAARDTAARAGRSARYAEALSELVEKALAAGQASLGRSLLFALGDVLEQDLGELDRAREAFLRAEASGGDSMQAWRAVLRVCTTAGDVAGQIRWLRRLVVAYGNELGGATQNEDLYRLAELELRSRESMDRGIESLDTALDRDPRYERAVAMLREAVLVAGSDQPALLAAYERVARASGDPATLLDALERASRQRRASAQPLREAVEIADQLGEERRAEALLERAVELAALDSSGPAVAAWALVALAERRERAGDLAGAVEWMRKAAELVEPADAFELSLRVAALAAGPIGDLALAARTYERLLERDPAERAAWEPLLDVYRRMGAEDALDARLAATADLMMAAEDRNRLRTERARLLASRRDREEDAVIALREILDEDPDNADASDLLVELCDRAGRVDVVVDVLGQRLEEARQRRDGPAFASISLRLGALLAGSRRELAADVYRAALEWAPQRRDLCAALLGVVDDPADRADVVERMLALETGEAAATTALALADSREALADGAGALRALAAGFRACPDDPRVGERLARACADQGDWARLAELTLRGAAACAEPSAAIARLREAAALYRDRLGDRAAAAAALRRALALAPADRAILLEVLDALGEGEEEAAIAEVSRALDHPDAAAADRGELLRARADLLRRAGRHDQALEDLDAAFALVLGGEIPPAIARDLAASLERRRQAAASAGDLAAERATTLRLVETLLRVGDAERARDVLAAWTLGRDDVEALRSLLELEAAAGGWEAAAAVAERLLPLEEGAARIDAVLRLAEACSRTGRPEAAKAGLEAALIEAPGDERVRAHLLALYDRIGAHRELAELWLIDAAQASDPEARFAKLHAAGERLLGPVGDATAAIAPLEEARRLRPRDQPTAALLADAYTAAGRLADATLLLDAAIAAHKGRRSRELASLQHRMARVAAAAGDRASEARWLDQAVDSDNKNGVIATELALAAEELGQLDVALKALRVVSLLKEPAPMSRAEAYLRQGKIHGRQGDARRAVLMAKRALSEDPELADAQAFLAEVGKG